MPSSPLKVTATVRVAVVISLSQPWTEDVTATQVFKQAEKDAIGVLQNFIADHNIHGTFSIVGTPTVSMVLVEQSR